MAGGGYADPPLRRHLGPRGAARVLRGRRRGAACAARVRQPAAPPARVPQQAFLPQQVRLPDRVAAVHPDAVRAGGGRRDPARTRCVPSRRSSAARAACCSCGHRGRATRLRPVASWPRRTSRSYPPIAVADDRELVASWRSTSGSSTSRSMRRDAGRLPEHRRCPRRSAGAAALPADRAAASMARS